jgi:hypothetical protein
MASRRQLSIIAVPTPCSMVTTAELKATKVPVLRNFMVEWRVRMQSDLWFNAKYNTTKGDIQDFSGVLTTESSPSLSEFGPSIEQRANKFLKLHAFIEAFVESADEKQEEEVLICDRVPLILL